MTEFNQRFDVLSKPVGAKSSSIFDMTDNKERAAKILEHVDLDSAQYRLGISVVCILAAPLLRNSNVVVLNHFFHINTILHGGKPMCCLCWQQNIINKKVVDHCHYCGIHQSLSFGTASTCIHCTSFMNKILLFI